MMLQQTVTQLKVMLAPASLEHEYLTEGVSIQAQCIEQGEGCWRQPGVARSHREREQEWVRRRETGVPALRGG